jgi:hypothetical protein
MNSRAALPRPRPSWQFRGSGVATSTPSSPSTTSRKSPNLQALDPGEPIYAERGLRALWTEWSVEVRVLSGAPWKAPQRGAFSCLQPGRCERPGGVPQVLRSGTCAGYTQWTVAATDVPR